MKVRKLFITIFEGISKVNFDVLKAGYKTLIIVYKDLYKKGGGGEGLCLTSKRILKSTDTSSPQGWKLGKRIGWDRRLFQLKTLLTCNVLFIQKGQNICIKT
jgi:hypothetical protein